MEVPEKLAFQKSAEEKQVLVYIHCYPIYSAWMMIYKNVEKE